MWTLGNHSGLALAVAGLGLVPFLPAVPHGTEGQETFWSVHLSSSQLRSTCCVPGAVPGSWETAVTKSVKALCLPLMTLSSGMEGPD